ncbi:hypothetical protein [Moheibacter sediminis]|uniref:YokE-like PH domain-containing protein n=1 Tax=Moheibacter sediminis TaxID=1434700 RepID=A0A1W2B3R3_9FLAO|nr:hypothetical protein [Moheibacter sediminis]SMC67576.1 hypothetical protein SAMN06296427_105230 [Moheibacter sediminis]
MSSEIIGLVFFFGMFIILIGGILLIAFVAARSRKSKQNKLLKELPSAAEFHSFVRYNRASVQGQFLKLKAFEGSGVFYIVGTKAIFKSTKGYYHEFDILNSKILWEGENLVNGLLKWFSINDGTEKLFLNVETGMFIFHTGDAGKATTRTIFDKLMLIQAGHK